MAGFLSDELGTEIRIDRIRVGPREVLIRGLYVEDERQNTLVESGRISVKPSLLSFSRGEYRFHSVEVDSTYFFLAKYEGEERANLQFLVDFFAGTDTTAKPEKPEPVQLQCNRIELTGCSFHLLNEEKTRDVDGIDYADMDFSEINLELSSFSISGDTISAYFRNLSCNEKSGVELRDFSGMARVSSTGFTVDSLRFKTNNSNLSLDLEFDYHHYIAFKNFIEEVSMHASINPSYIEMQDIGYFAPVLKSMKNRVKIEGGYDGTVEDFKASGFKFSFGKATKFYGDCAMAGLPDIKTTRTKLDINYFFTNKADVEAFALPGEAGRITFPDQVVNLGDIQLMGSFDGVYNDFEARALLVSELGPLRTDVEVTYLNEARTIRYTGELETESFDLGAFLELDFLGNITMDVEIFGSGITADDIDLYITGWVDSLDFFGNNYSQLLLGGDLTDEKFNGRFYLEDDLVNIDFTGLVDFERERPAMDFNASIKDANLFAMNISDRASDLLLSTDIKVLLDFNDLNDWSGMIGLKNLEYRENGYDYSIDSLTVQGDISPLAPDSLGVSSSWFDATMLGEYRLSALPGLFSYLAYDFLGEDLKADPFSADAEQAFSFEVKFHEPGKLTRLFTPFLDIAPGAQLTLNIRNQSELVDLEADADFLTLQGIRFSEWSMTLAKNGGPGRLVMLSDTAWFRMPKKREEMKDALFIENYSLNMNGEKGKVDWSMAWDDANSRDNNIANLAGYVLLSDSGRVESKFEKMEAIINGERWYIDPENYFVYDSNLLRFNKFNLYGEGQSIRIGGKATEKPVDTLNVSFRNWRLENFSPVINSPDIVLSGDINGDMAVSGLFHQPTVIAGLKIDDLTFNEHFLGEAGISSAWLPGEEAFQMGLTILQQGNLSKHKTVDINGKYYPENDKSTFDVTADINNLSIGMASPFLEGLFSGLEGFATGNLTFTGSVKEPVLSGSLKLMRSEFMIDYLNVEYSIAHQVYFDRNVIYISDALVYDPEGNRILTNAKVTHDYFKDFKLELNLSPENAIAFNTTRYMNSAFYGKAYASGDVNITGPFDDLLMDIDVKSGSGSNVSIPVSYTVDVTESDFIVFTGSQQDTIQAEERYKVDVKGLTLDLGVKADQNTNVELFLPGDMGFIRARGDGDIQMGIDSRGYFDIEGRYILRDGLFNFSLEQLVSKRFDIVSGSFIEWNGNIYDNEVGISALYRTKTSLAGLGLSLPQGQESQRVNVNLYIILTENLFNPNIRFSIQFPYLDESLKSNVYAILDTNDYGLMNQQAISLLVLNSFSYRGYASSQSPINSYSILTSQISSFLSKISNDFDIGVNYIPGDEITREEIEVALSTQLFDNRLIIDGNIDVPTNQSASSQSSSDIVGEVNIEYKLTPDGRFRVKAFNRSNTLNPLEQYSPYTQGVGFFYRKEFDNLKELFTPQKRLKKKKNDTEDE
jgi:hypothetical protein